MLLEGKKALIMGVANNRSIAWGITQEFKKAGARLAFSYVGDAIKKRVEPLSEEVGGEFTFGRLLPQQGEGVVDLQVAGMGTAENQQDLLPLHFPERAFTDHFHFPKSRFQKLLCCFLCRRSMRNPFTIS